MVLLYIGIFVLAVVLLCRWLDSDSKVEHENKLAKQKEREEVKALKRESLLKLLPDPDVVVEYTHNGFSSGNPEFVVVRENTNQILLNGHVYNFKDIIDFTLLDKQTVLQHHSGAAVETKTGNMIGRAVVGGVLAGGVGAVIGASTAKKEIKPSTTYSSTNHFYVINVTINSLTNPIERLCFFHNEQIASKVASILQVIVRRNAEELTDSNNPTRLVEDSEKPILTSAVETETSQEGTKQ